MAFINYCNAFDARSVGVNLKMPDKIEVYEHKAPTDESIRLMEEMHDKVISNIISRVKVEDNIVNGEVYAIRRPLRLNDLTLVIKFSINGKEYQVEKDICSQDLCKDQEWSSDVDQLSKVLHDRGRAVIAWYTLNKLAEIAFEKLTGQPIDERLLSIIK